MSLKVRDLRVFVPAKDLEESIRFYKALGFRMNWQHEEGLAEIQIGRNRIWLQNYYVKDWAENFMISLEVEDAAAWWRHINDLIVQGKFSNIRVKPPKEEPWGAMITYCWDPSGVLIHFSQPVKDN
jgi:catechol 2,3-dioxygenase-like lactoylglutathione lyase family enzyme